MYRASTPTHRLLIPIDPTTIVKLKLTYSQHDRIVLEKTQADMTNDGYIWTVTLTQEETNLFEGDSADAQIRYLDSNGKSFPSKKFRLYVGDVLNDEVMTE